MRNDLRLWRRVVVGLAVLLSGAALRADPVIVDPKLRAEGFRKQFAAVAKGTQSPEFVLVTTPTQQIEGTMTMTVTTPSLAAREWLLFAPLPEEVPGQREVKWVTKPLSQAVKELGMGRQVLFARVTATPATAKGIVMEVTYKAELSSRKLVPARNMAVTTLPKPAALDEKEAQRWLARSEYADFEKPEFQAYLAKAELVPEKNESDVTFARRVFLALANSATYEYKTDMDRHASKVCGTQKSDCGGLSVLYCAVLRANGIPARAIMGRWAKSAKEGEAMDQVKEYKQEHVKAEFFANEIGWIPVDVSAAVNTKPAFLRGVLFGKDAGDFLVLHQDMDLIVEAGTFGKQHLALMQNPAYWVTGQGSMDGSTYKVDWVVKQIEAATRPK